MSKTIEQWLNCLPTNIAKAALANVEYRYEGHEHEVYSSLPLALHDAFTWSETPQGREFWGKVAENALRLEELRVPNPVANRKALAIHALLTAHGCSFDFSLLVKVEDIISSEKFSK